MDNRNYFELTHANDQSILNDTKKTNASVISNYKSITEQLSKEFIYTVNQQYAQKIAPMTNVDLLNSDSKNQKSLNFEYVQLKRCLDNLLSKGVAMCNNAEELSLTLNRYVYLGKKFLQSGNVEAGFTIINFLEACLTKIAEKLHPTRDNNKAVQRNKAYLSYLPANLLSSDSLAFLEQFRVEKGNKQILFNDFIKDSLKNNGTLCIPIFGTLLFDIDTQFKILKKTSDFKNKSETEQEKAMEGFPPFAIAKEAITRAIAFIQSNSTVFTPILEIDFTKNKMLDPNGENSKEAQDEYYKDKTKHQDYEAQLNIFKTQYGKDFDETFKDGVNTFPPIKDSNIPEPDQYEIKKLISNIVDIETAGKLNLIEILNTGITEQLEIQYKNHIKNMNFDKISKFPAKISLSLNSDIEDKIFDASIKALKNPKTKEKSSGLLRSLFSKSDTSKESKLKPLHKIKSTSELSSRHSMITDVELSKLSGESYARAKSSMNVTKSTFSLHSSLDFRKSVKPNDKKEEEIISLQKVKEIKFDKI